jgi:CheY-like chemotaxis protein
VEAVPSLFCDRDDINDAKELPKRLSILFVDDDPVLRKLFSRKIKTLVPDWTVREAANGETALLLVEQQSFDVIFVDQYMASVEKQVRDKVLRLGWPASRRDIPLTLPILSQLLGTETVQALRSKGVGSLICGHSANDKEEEFLQAGADAFCIKPFPLEARAMTAELCRILSSERAVRGATCRPLVEPRNPSSSLEGSPALRTKDFPDQAGGRSGPREGRWGEDSGSKSRRGSPERSIDQCLPERLSVLFVDDDPILRKLFVRKAKLVQPGWTVSEAASGEAAVRLAEQEHFDLIFVDQYMASSEKQVRTRNRLTLGAG